MLSGIVGTLAGGWWGDRLQRSSAAGYLIVSGLGSLLGAPVTAYAIMTRSLTGCLTGMFLAECLLFLNTGPLNTAIINVTAPAVRAMAFAVNIFMIHALGDAISPTLMGALSDRWGLRDALSVTPLAMLLAAGLCLLCMRFVAEDDQRK